MTKNTECLTGEDVLSNQSIPDFQIILQSGEVPQTLRNLTAEHVNQLIKVPGIVISCSKTRCCMHVCMYVCIAEFEIEMSTISYVTSQCMYVCMCH